jgi:hypothetical protein
MTAPRLALALLLVAATARLCAADNGAHPKKAGPQSPKSPTTTSSATHAAPPSRGPAAGAQRCSMPFGSACDPGVAASTGCPAHVADDPAPTAHPAHGAAATASKNVSHGREAAGESPVFGPLFFAHQALML